MYFLLYRPGKFFRLSMQISFKEEGIWRLVKYPFDTSIFFPGIYSSWVWNIQRSSGCHGGTQWSRFDGTANQCWLVFCSGSTKGQEEVKWRGVNIYVGVGNVSKIRIFVLSLWWISPSFSFFLEVAEDEAGVQTGDVVDRSSVPQVVSTRPFGYTALHK